MGTGPGVELVVEGHGSGHEGGGELAGGVEHSVVRAVDDGGQQTRLLGGEPRGRLVRQVGQRFRRQGRPVRHPRGPARDLGRPLHLPRRPVPAPRQSGRRGDRQEPGGAARSVGRRDAGHVQPAGDQSAHRRLPLLPGVVGQTALPGVLARQIVDAVARSARLVGGHDLHEVAVHELFDRVLRVVLAHVQERPGDPRGEVGQVHQGQTAQGALLLLVQVRVAQSEARAHFQVACLQFVQSAALVPQTRREPRRCPVGAGGETGAGDTDGERKPTAQRDDLGGPVGLQGGPGRTGHAGQQVQCLRLGRHPQIEVGGALQRHEPAAGGDQHGRAAARREQRAQQGLADGVVEDEQDPAARDVRAVQPEEVLLVARRALRVHPEGAQQSGQGVRGPYRLGVRGTQVHEELSVGEERGGAMAHVDGQGGLAGARPAGDHPDGRRGAQRVAHLFQKGGRPGRLFGASYEVGHVGRELVGRRMTGDVVGPLGAAGRRCVLVRAPGSPRRCGRGFLPGGRGFSSGSRRSQHRRVRPEQGLVQRAQFRAGIHAQFRTEQTTALVVAAQRVGHPADAEQRGHQLATRALAEGVGGDVGDEFGNEIRTPVQVQFGGEAELVRFQPQFLQAHGLDPGEGLTEPFQGVPAAPQARGRLQDLDSLLGPPVGGRPPAGRERLLEAPGVHGGGWEVGHVTRGAGTDGLRALRTGQGAAQSGDVRGDERPRGGGRLLLPDQIDQPLDGQHLTEMHDESREDRGRFGAVQRDPVSPAHHLDRTQKANVHRIPRFHVSAVGDNLSAPGITHEGNRSAGFRVDRCGAGGGRNPSVCRCGWPVPGTAGVLQRFCIDPA